MLGQGLRLECQSLAVMMTPMVGKEPAISACLASSKPAAVVRETVTVTAGAAPPTASTATVAPPTGQYTGNGVWSVGATPSGGLQHAIPPGRYTVTVTGDSNIGTWIRCNSVLCGTSYPENIIKIANGIGADYSSVMDIEPTDVAIYMSGVTLTHVP